MATRPAKGGVHRGEEGALTLRFDGTRTTVKLGALGAALMSRAEARRIVERLTSFNHAVLDFSGVEVVGRGFCDEVFRVFARAHPDVAIEPVAMNDAVAFMVRRARSASPRRRVGDARVGAVANAVANGAECVRAERPRIRQDRCEGAVVRRMRSSPAVKGRSHSHALLSRAPGPI